MFVGKISEMNIILGGWEEIMKKTINATQVACVVSIIAIVVSIISMFVGGVGITQIIILCCMIAVFCSNLAIYNGQKKKDNE